MIDTSEWKEFRIDEIFTLKGGFYNKKPEHSVEGNIPFLAATEKENGVTEYYSKEDIEAWDKVGNCDNTLEGKIFQAPAIAVTVNGACCNAFYQFQNYTCSHDITSLRPKDGHMLKPEEGLFVCTIIQLEKYRWSYGRKPHDIQKLAAMIIKLPATPSGEPDWQYMEDFMGGLHCEPMTTSVKSSHIPLETEKWGEFRVGNLFDVDTGRDMDPDEETAGDIPVICLAFENNGVCMRVSCNKKHILYPAGCITVSAWAGGLRAFYQPEAFYVKGRVKILIPKKKYSANKMLFICSVLNLEDYRYSYGRKASADKIPNTILKLPITTSGEPDWQWMEDYIKSLPYNDRI